MKNTIRSMNISRKTGRLHRKPNLYPCLRFKSRSLSIFEGAPKAARLLIRR